MPKSYSGSKGRGKKPPFLGLPKKLLHSEEFASLSAYEVKILIDLGAFYNGSNNGDLCATWSIMGKRGWRSKSTLQNALQGCLDAGFLLKTKQGGQGIGPSLYALTWEAINECGGKLDVKSTTVALNLWRRKN